MPLVRPKVEYWPLAAFCPADLDSGGAGGRTVICLAVEAGTDSPYRHHLTQGVWGGAREGDAMYSTPSGRDQNKDWSSV
jgi:hypothetical protein